MSEQQNDSLLAEISCNQYTKIPHKILYDNSTSLGARGLLCFLLTYGEKMTFDLEFISKEKQVEEKKLKRVLKELVDKGYLTAEKGIYSIKGGIYD